MDHLWTPWRMPYLKRDNSGNDECIFCRKTRSTDDAAEHILFRGEHCFVTLNLYPYNNGHLMIVPYRHAPSLEELDVPTLTEMMTLTQQAIRVLRAAYSPQGYNIGINLGEVAGAGVAGHVHQHVVPRWAGDTNYITIIGQTRTIPEWIDETYRRLHTLWHETPPPDNAG